MGRVSVGDEQPAVRSDAGDAPEEGDGGNLRAHLFDVTVQRPDQLLEPVDDPFVGANESLLLRPEQGPGRRVDPRASLPCEQLSTAEAEPDRMQLGVDARGRLGTKPDEPGPNAGRASPARAVRWACSRPRG